MKYILIILLFLNVGSANTKNDFIYYKSPTEKLTNQKKLYILEIISPQKRHTYGMTFLTKLDCTKHKNILFTQNSGSGYGYKCVEKTNKTVNKRRKSY